MPEATAAPDATTQPFPTGGILSPDQGDQTAARPPIPPLTQTPPAPSPDQLGSAGLDSTMTAGLGGQTPAMPTGQVVQARHGGLLTGLVGVLLDGLASGMAPTAREAYEMPLRRAQMQAQQQQAQMQMQLEQQKMQMEMQEAPIRQRVQLAQLHLMDLNIKNLTAQTGIENVLGHAGRLVAEHEIEEGRGTAVATAANSAEGLKQLQQIEQTNPDKTLHHYMFPTTGDPAGKWTIYQFYPDTEVQETRHIPLPAIKGPTPDTSVDDQSFDIKAGSDSLSAELDAKARAERYTEEVKMKTAMATAMMKPGSWNEDAYQQYVRGVPGDSKNPPHPNETRLEFMNKLPQTVERVAGQVLTAAAPADLDAAKSIQKYTNFTAEIDRAQGAFELGARGNNQAAAIAPLGALLADVAGAGIKRVNTTELDMHQPGAYGIKNRVDADLARWTGGPLPPEYMKDFQDLFKLWRQTAWQEHKDTVDSINTAYRERAKAAGIKWTDVPYGVKPPAGPRQTVTVRSGGKEQTIYRDQLDAARKKNPNLQVITPSGPTTTTQ